MSTSLTPGCEGKENSKLSFSELVSSNPIANHFLDLTINHPLHNELVEGTLPLDKFKGFIQQDDLYTGEFLQNFLIIADREEDEGRKGIFTGIASAKETCAQASQLNYDKFHFSRATHMTPPAIEYLGTQRIASHNEHVGIALSTVGTCLLVWAKIGQHWKKIGVNSTENPYEAFLGHVMKNTDTAYMTELLDGYYERLPSSALQKRMVDAYVESVQFEYRFASAFYNFAAPESTPPPKFTDLFNLISPEVAKSVTSHLLYVEIGNGTLPLSKYIDLIQQSLLFQRGFHAAWESLERKESDLSLKPRLLAESNTETYKSLQGQMKEFNFADGASTAGYAADYIHHLTGIGRNGRVAEGIVALYPRYLLWDEIGAQVNKGIPDIGTHPYKTWLKMVNPENPPDRLSRMRDLTNEYYERESLEGKYRMINVMRQSITHELQFVNGVYGAIQNLI